MMAFLRRSALFADVSGIKTAADVGIAISVPKSIKKSTGLSVDTKGNALLPQ